MVKVSVIIPTYNRSKYLKRAIESVLGQTYKNIELIVVDDNGKNSEVQLENERLIKNYKDAKIKYIVHEKNKNGAAARNSGIEKSEGDYITFLDDDDFYLKNRIYKMVELLEGCKNYDGVYTNVIKVKNNKIRNIIKSSKEGSLQREMLCHDSFFGTGSNIFIRTDTVKELKGFDESFKRYQDLEFMVRFFNNHKIKHLDEFLVVKDETSRINAFNQKNLYEMLKLFLMKFEKNIKTQKNPEVIYDTVYNKIYNKLTDKEVKNQLIKDMKKHNVKPKKSLRVKLLNRLVHLRKWISIIRGKLLKKKLPDDIKKEVLNVLEKEV